MKFIKSMFFLEKYTDWPTWLEIAYKITIWVQFIRLITLIIK